MFIGKVIYKYFVIKKPWSALSRDCGEIEMVGDYFVLHM